MKKEIHPAVIVTALVLLVGAVIGFYAMSGSQDTKKVDVKTLDPKSLEDPDPRADRGRGRPN